MSKDYLYGKLNSTGSQSTDYTGGTTSTAKVTVDNDSRLIYVDAKIDVRKVEAEIEQARAEIAVAKKDYLEILEKYSTFKQDILTLKNNDILLLSEINSVSSLLEETDERLTQSIAQTKSELKEDINRVIVQVEQTIQPKLDTLTAGLASANTRIDEATTKINNVNTRVDNVEAEISLLSTEVRLLITQEINKLKQDIEKLKQDILTIIDTELTKVKSDITTLNTTLTNEIARAKTAEENKQDKLVSGFNIKTINNTPLLGAGNIDIKSAVWGNITGDINKLLDLIEAISKGGSKDYTDLKFAEAKTLINTKTDHLFYDQFGTIDPDLKEVWYLMAWVDGVEKIVAGPYALGGGGGSGSITEMTSTLKVFPETVSRSATSCEIVFNWTSTKGTSKIPTGNGTIYIYVDGVLKMTVGNAPQGDNTIDILPAIKDVETSNTTVNIKVTDAYNNYELKSGTIKFVDIYLTSSFDADKIYKTSFTFDCTPYGVGLDKTIKYYVDDYLIGQKVGVKTSGELVSFLIDKGAGGTPLTHGAHTLKVYFICTISGEEVSSNILNYNFMYEVQGDTTPMITSSFDASVKLTLYIAFTIPYKVYSPGKNYSHVIITINGEVYQDLPEVAPRIQYLEYRANDPGNYLIVISCEDQNKTFNVVVEKAEIDIRPVTEKLALYLTPVGRDNSESEAARKKWIYEYKTPTGETETIEATLYNFNFQSDGWLKDEYQNSILKVSGDALVEIPYKVFEEDCKDSGKTIELEFSTSQVLDYNTEIISCFYERDALSVGFKVTALEAMFKSMSTEGVSSQYKEEEHIRIAFTVDKVNENRLIMMYINGVLCNAVQYPRDDSFRQPQAASIVIGSSAATTNIYGIRVYDNNLTMKLIVNNWIADTQSGEEKIERYLRNNIFSSETGEITVDMIPDNLPYMIWDINPLPLYKGDKRPGNVRYVEKDNSAKNFTAKNAQYNVQGTSSAVYPVKNIRIKYKLGKNDDGTLWDTFEWYDDEGNTLKKFAIKDGIADNYFTYKVDFASSEGVNNVELVRLYNDVAKEAKYLNPPQKADSNIRVGIDGYPIAAFHKDTVGNVVFATKANFNNDKANEAVYGFAGHWDDETKPIELRLWVGDESWEITQNNAAVAIFKEAVTAENFSQGFEIRFPDEDGYDKLDKLGPMSAWVVSTDSELATNLPLPEPKLYTYTTVVRGEDGSYSEKTITSPVFTTDSADYRLIKFKAELKDWFDINSTIFYYVFTHMFLLVDSRAKNCFPTYFASRTAGDGGDRWFWLPYDMDTAIGINNEGKLRFSYNLEDTDKDEKGANVFNGQDSVMWCNLRKTFLAEISQMYYNLRKTDLTKTVNFCFEDVENRFEEHLSKWPENLLNKDSEIKYIDTLVQSGEDYLEMLQGDKALQRKWWLFNRFKYMDAKYLAGDARSDVLIFRAYGKSDMDITPFADTYITVSFANSEDAYVSTRAKKGQSYHITNPLTTEVTDQETHIFAVSLLKSLGDLSGFKPDTVQALSAIHLLDLKIGDSSTTYQNPNLTSINVSMNTLLQYLDVTNCINLKTPIDVSNCTEIEKVWCKGTQVSSVTLPDAGIMKSLRLPSTITKLIIKNHPLLVELDIENVSGISLSELWIENMKNFTAYKIYDLVRGMAPGSLVRLIDINDTYNTVAEVEELYDALADLKGIDAQGRLVDKPLLNGKIYINAEINYTDWVRLQNQYTDVTITAKKVLCTVNFMQTEAEVTPAVIYRTLLIEKCKAAYRPTPDPEKAQTERYYYTFTGWDKSFEVVESDMTIYPIYEEHDRLYTVTFDTRTTEWTTPPQTAKYGETISEPAKPRIPGATFLGWYDDQGNLYSFATTPVTKDFTLTAKWSSDVGPTISISKTSYDTFSYQIKDDIGITGYAITTSDQVPLEWTETTPTALIEGTYTIDHSATYYVWAKDENLHTNYANIIAYPITKTLGEGTVITIVDGTTPVENYCLQDLTLTISYTADEHYENVKFYSNDVEVQVVPFTVIVDKAYTFRTESTPKTYLVLFDNMGIGDPVPSQNVLYNRLVTPPENLFVEQKIIDAWYTTNTFEFENRWDFAADRVSKDMTLYAHWIEYKEPSVIGATITDSTKTISCNFMQTKAYGVDVDWGDGNKDSSSKQNAVISLNHTYEKAGTYNIKIACKDGAHYLGGGQLTLPVITPASVINTIEFAWNMSYTNPYALYGAVNLNSVSISKYMTMIANSMFSGCIGLKSIILPEALTRIEAKAFFECSGLTGTFTVPNSVNSIGESAFLRCSKLIGIEIPSSVVSIGAALLAECSSIEYFDIPSYITSLPNNMFNSCSSLKEIVIPRTVATLGTSVFYNCSSLEKVIMLNENLVAGESCFQGCSKLKTGGPYIPGEDNYNIEYTWTEKIPVNIFATSSGGSQLESFVLANTIKEIGARAFALTSLKTINFPVGLITIGDAAFFNCYNLLGPASGVIELPNTLTTIGTQAFSGCGSVTNLNIPASVTSIGNLAFSKMYGLITVQLHNANSTNKITSASLSWFYGCTRTTVLHILKAIKDTVAYQFGAYWNYRTDDLTLTYYADLDE